MLDIVASYHWMQFQGNLVDQTWENGKNLVSAPIFTPLAQIRVAKFLFPKVWLRQPLDIMFIYHDLNIRKN